MSSAAVVISALRVKISSFFLNHWWNWFIVGLMIDIWPKIFQCHPHPSFFLNHWWNWFIVGLMIDIWPKIFQCHPHPAFDLDVKVMDLRDFMWHCKELFKSLYHAMKSIQFIKCLSIDTHRNFYFLSSPPHVRLWEVKFYILESGKIYIFHWHIVNEHQFIDRALVSIYLTYHKINIVNPFMPEYFQWTLSSWTFGRAHYIVKRL